MADMLPAALLIAGLLLFPVMLKLSMGREERQEWFRSLRELFRGGR